MRAVSVLPGSFATRIADAGDPPIDGAVYVHAGGAFLQGLLERIAAAPDDLSCVVDAIVDADTAASPAERAVVASEVMTATLGSVAALDELHAAEAERSGLT